MNAVYNYENRRNDWSPFSELQREMNRIFSSPVCEIQEGAEDYLLTLEVPGVPKDKLEIGVRDEALTVKGERPNHGKFTRSFSLPAGTDAEKIEASCEDGLLRIVVPKPAAAKPKQIKISNTATPGLLTRWFGHSKEKKEEQYSSPPTQAAS